MITDHDVDILARTIYGEAEANNTADAVAIAWVIVNRLNYENWPDTLAGVCLQPWQFSCWNPADPNRQRILAAKGKWFEKCKKIANEVVKTIKDDPTICATHYYATYVKTPKWAKGHKPCYETIHTNGHRHLFFNDIDTAPPKSAREALEQSRPLADSGTIKAARQGVVAAGAVGVVGEAINQLQPALPLAQTLAQYAPWGVIAILTAAIGFMAWRRIDDRAKGLR
jgi:hypothetical protein